MKPIFKDLEEQSEEGLSDHAAAFTKQWKASLPVQILGNLRPAQRMLASKPVATMSPGCDSLLLTGTQS